ncbi:MAG: amidase, partial [Pseudomonadota bacterium]
KGLPTGPFTGVPFLLKEFEALSGFPLTHSCEFFKSNIADYDSEIVNRFRQGGLVFFGKTNTPEFSLSVNTEPRMFGSTRNPWNLNNSTGGSSGGAAAAVASGIVPVAQASDGGGSIRVPASCCGLFGMKPTRGRTPWGPKYGESWSGMHGVHVLSRTVRDSAAMLDLISGPDLGAPYWAPKPKNSYLQELELPTNKLKIGYLSSQLFEEVIEPDCEDAVSIAIRQLADHGHELEECTLKINPDGIIGGWLICAANTILEVEKYAAEANREITEEYFERVTWNLMEWCKSMSATEYLKWTQTLHRVGREFNELFNTYDVFITPMLGKPPIQLGELDMMTESLEEFFIKFADFNPYAFLSNFAGNPAMSVPIHWTKENLPIGVQFVSRYGDEATLFKLARQLEQSMPWSNKIPDIHVSKI